MVVRRTFSGAALAVIALAVMLILGCGDETETGASLTSDVVSQADDAQGGVDATFTNYCRGTAAQPNLPKYIHDECQGVTDCTVMTAKTDGNCFCAICGLKGPTPACWQQQCPQAGGQ